jgi:hypothetical protein
MASQTETVGAGNTNLEAAAAESETILPTGWRFDILFALPILAILPMSYLEIGSLWSRIHTRFFPLPLVAVLVLVFWQGSVTKTASIKRLTVSYVLLLIGSVLVVANFWMLSPWIAQLCSVVLLSGWALTRLGEVAWPRILGWTTLLATTIRLPGNFDIQLLSWLEGVGTSIASSVLDGLSVPYLHRPNAITVAGLSLGEVRELYIDETVRNLSSLYALVSIAVLLLILQRRSLIVGAITLLSMPMWYVLYVVIQILGVVLFLHYGKRDISQDRDWIMLSLLNFVFVSLMIVGFIQCLAKLSLPVPASDGEFEPEFQLINTFMCWPQPDPFKLEDSEVLTPLLVKPPEDLTNWRSASRVLQRLSLACVAIATVVAVFSSSRAMAINRSLAALPLVKTETLDKVASSESLPAKLEDCVRVDFQRLLVERNNVDHGVLSWKYAWQGQVIDIIVEFPFHGSEGSIASNFERQGWRVLRQEAMKADSIPPEANKETESAKAIQVEKEVISWIEIHLENELGGRAITLFRFDSLDPSLESTAQASAPSYQVQLFCESGTELTRSQLKNLRRIYVSMHEILRKQLQFQLILESSP